MNDSSGRLSVEMRCVVHAGREQVFEALTEPGALAMWWGPSRFTTPEIEVDLRVGGRYRFGMQPPDGALFHLAGEFLEVSPPSRLVYTFHWEEPDPDDRKTVVQIFLQSVGDSTEVSMLQGDFATEARRALHERGWTDSFDKLRTFIESDLQRLDGHSPASASTKRRVRGS